MPHDDRHNTRQAILASLERKGRRPCDLAELADDVETDGVTVAQVREELPGLEDHGYVQNLTPGRGVLLKLTASGRDQIKRDAPLEEYVWGKDAFIG